MLRRWILSTLLLASLVSAGTNGNTATGTMSWTCTPEFGMRIYLDGPGSLQLLYAQGSGYKLEPGHSIPMRLFSCRAPDCFDLGNAAVLFDSIDDKGASGSYVVQSPDGSKRTGSFKVMREKQPKPFLCM